MGWHGNGIGYLITIEKLLYEQNFIFGECQEIVKQRGKEYATDVDTLKTFREVGEEHGIPASKVAAILLSIKYKRIMEQLKNGKIPTDSFRDLINYTVYVEVLLKQETNNASIH